MLRHDVFNLGLGIAPEQQCTVLEAVIQADGFTTRGLDGTGLGAAVVRHVVGRMGRYVELNSTPDLGSSFQGTLRLGVPVG
jgi:signal transduction histidine kinase